MSILSHRPVAALILSCLMQLSLTGLATAQNAGAPGENDRVLDTVTIEGIQNDPAMAAFRAGDFATAEVEFLDNAMCALRRERNLSASIDGARLESARADTFANAQGPNSGANSRGAGAGASQDIPTGIASPSGVSARNIQTEQDRTCEARGHQLYMAAMSQIQLGKTDEALRNLEKATAASKSLYDAHYKIGLIKLLKGDKKTAEAELKKIESILARCRRCDSKQEIADRQEHLSKAIKGEISLQ